MNQKIFQTLEFPKIIQQVAQFSRTHLGKELITKMQPASSKDKLEDRLAETQDGQTVLRLKGGIPLPKLANVDPHMKRIEIGADLNGAELVEVRRVLEAAEELGNFFAGMRDNEVELPTLYGLSDQLTILPELRRDLQRSLDEDGTVTDEASSELRSIHQQITRLQANIRQELDDMLRQKAKYLTDTLITMRNDRYVLPVKAEYRNVFGGVVHDQSGSGQTLFIEPRAVVELNNRLRQAQIRERQEIERILAELSAKLVPERRAILQNAYLLGRMDEINARAYYGKSVHGTVPQIAENNQIYFKQARHPLLDPKTVVANDIYIGGDVETIVITGPNTGGKTITLKTLGLLQLMAQSGLPIPVGEDSKMGIFDEIFADIGDEQSIEQSLSTFSSHMTTIVSVLKKADAHSLVLFDELGAGTDPQEGAALAIAILDDLAAKGSMVMATTHYPELKIYGYNRPKTINASMEFDVDTLSPTYRLLIGVPGRSNAFEISKRLGLDPQLIENAKTIMNDESQDLNEMISDLENQRKMAETEYQEYRRYEEKAEKLYLDLKEAYQYFFEEREKELNKAKKRANILVNDAEEEADKIISDIRKLQLTSGQKGNVKEHQLIEAKTKLKGLHQDEVDLSHNKVLKKAKEKKTFHEGDEVLVETYGQRGTLLHRVNHNEWQVQLGILKMQVPEKDLTPVAPAKEPKQRTVVVRSGAGAHVSPQLDLRGERYDQALHEVDQYLDAAILAGYSQVTIIHGKGTGALRKGITDYLKNHRSVKKFEFAPSSQGGNGATIVYFK